MNIVEKDLGQDFDEIVTGFVGLHMIELLLAPQAKTFELLLALCKRMSKPAKVIKNGQDR